jgi:hypothetical protein
MISEPFTPIAALRPELTVVGGTTGPVALGSVGQAVAEAAARCTPGRSRGPLCVPVSARELAGASDATIQSLSVQVSRARALLADTGVIPHLQLHDLTATSRRLLVALDAVLSAGGRSAVGFSTSLDAELLRCLVGRVSLVGLHAKLIESDRDILRRVLSPVGPVKVVVCAVDDEVSLRRVRPHPVLVQGLAVSAAVDTSVRAA